MMMKCRPILRPLAFAVSILLLMAPSFQLATADTLSKTQKQEIQTLIEQYIIEHPEIVVKALEAMKKRQQQEEEQRIAKEIQRLSNELFYSSGSPILGNPKGTVNLVFFFDYQCTYCKQMAGMLVERLKNERNVRIVMKEFPILGPESFMMAQAALAARKQGKYEAFHLALMASRTRLTTEQVQKIAEGLGINLKQLSQDMQSTDVLQELDKNRSLGELLNIHGTPAFIVGRQVVVGAPNPEDLVAALRQLAKQPGSR
ncbi:MAG TPA: DsbA family protein [Alphaproteobacteria bacterium]|nr:DsbA family protein [Alphaproteobacteria bacterium]